MQPEAEDDTVNYFERPKSWHGGSWLKCEITLPEIITCVVRKYANAQPSAAS